jgi:RNA polymerase sigma-70 factor (ECF subfamily)
VRHEDDLSEAALVSAFLARRDETAFVALYRAHTPVLLGFAMRLLAGRRSEAEEVVQETWIRAVTNLSRFDGRSMLSTWLCGIAVNVFRERQRRRGPRDTTLAERADVRPPAELRGTGRVDLERAVENLPDGCREVLLLHDVEGYTHEEIAALLGVKPGTSKSQLSRARALVRAMLSGERPETTRSSP